MDQTPRSESGSPIACRPTANSFPQLRVREIAPTLTARWFATSIIEFRGRNDCVNRGDPFRRRPADPAGGLEVGNTVHVRANETDPNLEDNTATDSLMLLSDPNVAPTVNLTNPSNGDLFVGPANITVTANANDTDGTIASLELFDNGTSIGTAVSVGANEYSFSWNNVPFGDHSLLAVATDNNGKQTRSNAASIVVNGSAIVTILIQPPGHNSRRQRAST